MKKQERKKRKNIVIWILLFLFILVIILSGLVIGRLGRIGLVPTGNFDTFNIICSPGGKYDCTITDIDDDDEEYKKIEDDDKIIEDDDKPQIIKDATDKIYKDLNKVNDALQKAENETTKKDENIDETFSITDDDKAWGTTNKLNIFNNQYFEYKNIIAPGSSNAYEFKINNSSTSDVVYSMTFIEDNVYNVNMKYKLKRNGKYILGGVGSWEDITSINSNEYEIKGNKNDIYILEWKWVDGDNDTEIGQLDDATYGINIEVVASQK